MIKKAVASAKGLVRKKRVPKKVKEPGIVSVTEVLDKVMIGVELVDQIILNGPNNQYPTPNNYTFSNKIILIEKFMSPGGTSKCKYLYFFDYTRATSIVIVVPDDFKMRVLSDEEMEPLLAKHETYMLDNLRQALPHGFTIGSDPEIFLTDGEKNLIPAFDFLGSKEKPNVGPHANNKIYWDGFQAEFDTQSGTCLASHSDNVHYALKDLYHMALKHNSTALLSLKTTFDLTPKQLNDTKDEHIAFGCMPSLNVYGMKGISANGRDVPYRSSGGHIHFGIGKKSSEEIERIVKALDAILGVACVSLFAKYDTAQRRMMYGLAGEYRLPPHGLEYRTLSNAWLCHPLAMHLTFDLARKALVFGQKGLLKYWQASEEETIQCINKCDVKLAREIMERNKKLFCGILLAAFHDSAYTEVAYGVFFNGIESAVKDPESIITNWDLNKKEWSTQCAKPGATWRSAKSSIAAKIKVS